MRINEEDLFGIVALVPTAEELADRAKEMTAEDDPEAEALEFGYRVRWTVIGVLHELRGEELEEAVVLEAVEKAVREASTS